MPKISSQSRNIGSLLFALLNPIPPLFSNFRLNVPSDICWKVHHINADILHKDGGWSIILPEPLFGPSLDQQPQANSGRRGSGRSPGDGDEQRRLRAGRAAGLGYGELMCELGAWRLEQAPALTTRQKNDEGLWVLGLEVFEYSYSVSRSLEGPRATSKVFLRLVLSCSAKNSAVKIHDNGWTLYSAKNINFSPMFTYFLQMLTICIFF
jgi:hypothetical protein